MWLLRRYDRARETQLLFFFRDLYRNFLGKFYEVEIRASARFGVSLHRCRTGIFFDGGYSCPSRETARPGTC